MSKTIKFLSTTTRVLFLVTSMAYLALSFIETDLAKQQHAIVMSLLTFIALNTLKDVQD